MAKPLTFVFQNDAIECSLDKVDRAKLYGYVDTEVVDESGEKCDLVTLAGDGQTLVARGGTGQAYLSPDGQWRNKSDLKPVDLEGLPITPVKSSFESPIELKTTATIDEFLSHTITSVYQLDSQSTPVGELDAELSKGTIYTFPFSYRGGLEASTAFLLKGSDGHRFMLVGVPSKLEFVGLKDVAETVIDETTEETSDDDVMDFNLV